MSRIVILGLADSDVDVLSRLPGLEPRPSVVVAHPDPTALVLQLASLSDLSTTTEAPTPRSGDVVVVPENAGPDCASWVDAFRAAGAQILYPDAFPDGMGTEAEAETADGGNGAAAATETTMSDDTDQERPRRPELSIVRPSQPLPADIWTDPATTFRYLLEQAVGPETPATLWWDGAIGVWVPWLWTGPSPASEGKAVVKLASAYGGFRITGDWTEAAELPAAALTRVAEDMALRDLAVWEKTAAGLPGRDIPRGRDALRRWAAPVLRVLDPETAWLWERQPDGWKLRDVVGGDVTFSGELLVSEHMLGALFEGPGMRWERWRPAEHLSIHLGVSPDDGQWPLRWARVKKAMAAKA